MRLSRPLLLSLLLAVFTVSVSAQTIQPRGGSISPIDNSNSFVHYTSNTNTVLNTSTLVSEPLTQKSPLTDNNPNVVIFLTRNITQSAAYHATPYGIYNEGSRWAIFNENNATTMIPSLAFNVQVMGKGDNVFVHTATAANTDGHVTYLDHPLLNGDSDGSEIVIVTPKWTGTYNPNYIGVYYDSLEGKWAIFNENIGANMPIGASFNVQVVRDLNNGFTQLATVGNIVSTSKTEINNINLNNNPYAQFLVTQNWSLGNTYNNKPIGVEYDNASQRWRIINIDGSAMPTGAGFNILLTNTETVIGSGDGVLVNGGFEVPLTTKNTVSKWNTTNAGAGSKRICNKYAPKSPVSKDVTIIGECAYLLKGAAGQTRKIVQTVKIPLVISSNNVIDLDIRLKAVNATGVKITGVVTMSNGSVVNYKIPANQTKGTYDWDTFGTFAFYSPANQPKKLVLTISITGGSLYIDGVNSSTYMGGA